MTRHLRMALLCAATTIVAATGCGGSDDGAAPDSTTSADPATTEAAAEGTTADSASPSGGTNALSDRDAWIAYQADRPEEGVWLIRPDGSEDRRIAADIAGQQLLPDWSPDGSKLVFTTRGDVPELLYEYDLESDEARPLVECVDPCIGDDEPAYSPDGTQVVFSRAIGPIDDATGPAECGLFVADVATGQATQLTSHKPCDPRDWMPRWSPDGTQIAYWVWQEDETGTTGTAVFTIDVAGGEPRQLTEWDQFAATPDWSPDGEWIVYGTYPLNAFDCCEVSNLFRMKPDGAGTEQLTELGEDARATQPRFTPEGDFILFTSATPETRTISAIPADGGEPFAITDASANPIYTHPTMQP